EWNAQLVRDSLDRFGGFKEKIRTLDDAGSRDNEEFSVFSQLRDINQDTPLLTTELRTNKRRFKCRCGERILSSVALQCNGKQDYTAFLLGFIEKRYVTKQTKFMGS